MTREEAVRVYMAIEANWSVQYRNERPEQTKANVDLWASIFADIDGKKVWDAVMYYIKSGERFPPAPGIIYHQLMEDAKPKTTVEEARDAWRQVEKAVRRGQFYAKEDFKRLPVKAQRILGSYGRIIEMGLMHEDEFMTYEKPRFIKEYLQMDELDARRESIYEIHDIDDRVTLLEQKGEKA